VRADDDPVAARSAINTHWILRDSRVRAGVKRVRQVWSAASLLWPVAGQNALTIKVNQGCGRPATGGHERRPGCGW
jgi:hypothetical protein